MPAADASPWRQRQKPRPRPNLDPLGCSMISTQECSAGRRTPKCTSTQRGGHIATIPPVVPSKGDVGRLPRLSRASTAMGALAVLLLFGTGGVLAACPNMCSGHGECGPSNVCDCETGWGLVADCSLKECPTGVSWGSKVRWSRLNETERQRFMFAFV